MKYYLIKSLGSYDESDIDVCLVETREQADRIRESLKEIKVIREALGIRANEFVETLPKKFFVFPEEPTDYKQRILVLQQTLGEHNKTGRENTDPKYLSFIRSTKNELKLAQAERQKIKSAWGLEYKKVENATIEYANSTEKARNNFWKENYVLPDHLKKYDGLYDKACHYNNWIKRIVFEEIEVFKDK